MEKTSRAKEHRNPETPRSDQLAKQSPPQLTHRTSPHQTKQRGEPEAPNLKVISDPFEHQLSEMESTLSHHVATMHSQLDNGFSRLRDDVSDLSDTLNESVDRLEGTVDRFVSTMRWYLVLAGATAIVGVAFLIWQILFS